MKKKKIHEKAATTTVVVPYQRTLYFFVVNGEMPDLPDNAESYRNVIYGYSLPRYSCREVDETSLDRSIVHSF